ncbi:probable E3 ubiquitin-protein ligase LUL4 [Lycium ferocissimum]|uniref:probable E3 ubiquitin-protein ligase LUL4 n=1 Tax=Lycium ferocissimum TaxID=112874 RepID=UPI002815C46E|nr:probable E3 ubiquitin-protein ligase LUL4 [Lycium ferocissimum]
MGISQSNTNNRRRNHTNNWNNHPYYAYPSSSYSYYSPDPTYHTHPPPPPPFPFPPHLLPPPPPPSYTCHCTNPTVVGRSVFAHNDWPVGSYLPPPHQVVGMVAPSPYGDTQQAKKVRSGVNVHKGSLKLELDEHNPHQHLVSFVFDALFDGNITVFYFVKEEPHCRFVPIYPHVHVPITVPFQRGLGQKFRQPSGTGIDLGFFEMEDLSELSSDENVFHLVITATTCLPSVLTEDHISDTLHKTSLHMQISQAVLEKDHEGALRVRITRQILWVDNVRYELHELYGIGNSGPDYENNGSGKECVICMTERKDTAVLPCRHLCMCNGCANTLRLQSNRCPICRQPFEELLEININNGDTDE